MRGKTMVLWIAQTLMIHKNRCSNNGIIPTISLHEVHTCSIKCINRKMNVMSVCKFISKPNFKHFSSFEFILSSFVVTSYSFHLMITNKITFPIQAKLLQHFRFKIQCHFQYDKSRCGRILIVYSVMIYQQWLAKNFYSPSRNLNIISMFTGMYASWCEDC